MSYPQIRFAHGSLLVSSNQWSAELASIVGHHFKFDDRIGEYRALASAYRQIILDCHAKKFKLEDQARQFQVTDWQLQNAPQLRPYQEEALNAWLQAKKWGSITLPTGSGKTFLAMCIMAKTCRSTLVVVPTLDLVNQWCEVLETSFGIDVSRWAGGEHTTGPVTVSTYDSAQIHMEAEGDRFGHLIFDECHHLPAERYQWIAKMSLAPFRLGLSATPERSDGGEVRLIDLIGPEVYRAEIAELKGRYLSSYETQVIEVPLGESELHEYLAHRKVYIDFLKEENIDFSHPNGWNQFLKQCFKTEQGRLAHRAYLEQKKIIKQSESKLKQCWQILWEHRHERVLIFTNDNDTAYEIGERFSLPVLTHQTKIGERRSMLQNFREGRWPWLVTSKVLNEGVDVPEVNVGIIVSGSGSVREHVQRLGRLLRKTKHGQAKLIELISSQTAEIHQSARRREHKAYQ